MPDNQALLNTLDPKQDNKPFGRLALDPGRMGGMLKFIVNALAEPIRSAEKILQQGATPPSQMNIDVGRESLMSGPGAMLPGFGRALGGSAVGGLGATGAQILQRSDAIKLARQLREQGKTYPQIADALRTRFEPLLDDGAKITDQMVIGRGQRTKDSFELGALGGGGNYRNTGPPNFTVDDVLNMLKEEGVPVKNVHTAKTGTTYIKYEPPGNPIKTGESAPVIRIPSPDNVHAGAAPKNHYQAVNKIDTSGVRGKTGSSRDVLTNASGEKYNNLDTVREAVRWRTGTGLVPPGSQPRVLRERSTPELPPPAFEQPPNQLNMMNKMLEGPPQRVPTVAGGTPGAPFSSQDLSARHNLVSPNDFTTGKYPNMPQQANSSPPKLPGIGPEQQTRFDHEFQQLLDLLKSQK